MAIDDIISTTEKPRRDKGSRRSASRALAFGMLALVAGVSVAAMLARVPLLKVAVTNGASSTSAKR